MKHLCFLVAWLLFASTGCIKKPTKMDGQLKLAHKVLGISTEKLEILGMTLSVDSIPPDAAALDAPPPQASPPAAG